GKVSFQLPDLRGRTAISPGILPKQQAYKIAEKGGSASSVLNEANLPAHTHFVFGDYTVNLNPLCSDAPGFTGEPEGFVPAATSEPLYDKNGYGGYFGPFEVTIDHITLACSPTGFQNPQPVDTLSPLLMLNFIICVNGLMPDRS